MRNLSKRGAWLLMALLVASPATAAIRPVAGGAETVAQNGTLLRVEALSDTVLRVRLAPDGTLSEDASWAVLADRRRQRAGVTATANGFRTGAIVVQIDPATLALRVSDRGGRVIVADSAEPLAYSGKGFALSKSLVHGQHFYGLGDKTGGLDRLGKTFVDWNTDAYGFDPAADPLYKSIPFFIAASATGPAYGILLDNSWRSSFDFGHREADRVTLGSNDGPIDYYIITGSTVRDVVRGYIGLTGPAPLAPRWALGFQQSRYSYMSADEVRALVARFRAEKFPLDVVWLDIDYQDRNRPFTVNKQAFPDLKGLFGDLRTQGVRAVPIVDLHIAAAPNEHYRPYDEGIAGDHFVHNPDGSLYVAPVWPGPAVFPDFTRDRTRQWWGTLFKSLSDAGAAGIWNDMNEPAIFETPTKTMPLDTVHRIEGSGFAPRRASHAEIHNVFGMENSRATTEGLLALRPTERPFVMTRASYAGGHRYATTWTGDNSSSWDHLKLSVSQLLNLGLSGFSYAGADVGGFVHLSNPDLMDRWFQVAAFSPIFRAHSANNTPRAEPWVDGPSHLAIRRAAVEERYRLMPYIYAAAAENARTGDPLMRPLFYDYPDALTATCDQSMSFTLGGRLLVAASPRPDSAAPYDVCLPKGGWYDYWTGAAVTPSAKPIMITPTAERIPLFVRAGSIIPRQSLVQTTDARPSGPLELHVYPGPDCVGALYDDDGHSIVGAAHPAMRQALTCATDAAGRTHVTFGRREGGFRPWWTAIRLVDHATGAETLIADTGRRGRTVVVAQRQ